MKNNLYDKKIFRLFYILNKLNEKGSVKVSELTMEFNVTPRTVQRDIVLLDTVGFPLMCEHGEHKFMPGFSLRKMTINPEEKFLLMLFFNLFSKAGAPFDTVANNFFNKTLFTAHSEEGIGTEIFALRQRKILCEEFGSLKKRLTARLEDIPCPPAYEKKVNEILDEIRIKSKKLNTEHNVNIEFKVIDKNYRSRKPIATITVPKTYFNNPYQKLDFSTLKKGWVFSVYIDLPCKMFSSFRIGLGLDMYFKFFGPHLKGKKIACFDKFAGYLGFKNSGKRFEYEYSYGNDKDILITRGSVTWEKVIPMPLEEIISLRTTTGGYIAAADYSKRKRVRK